MMHYDNEPERAMHGAEAVAHFLDRKHASYELIEHHATYAAQQEASAAGSAAPRMAKTVVLHDTDGYRIAIIPASGRVDLRFSCTSAPRRPAAGCERSGVADACADVAADRSV
jgi:prolyl-tRNA editing enzyme YbaK/EbsC (Cys-tRNA(Pro) deacylase)